MSSIITFTTVGSHTFSVQQNTECDILLVGGGGGGGSIWVGGGGGGGDVIEKFNYILNPGTYTVTVGDGGNPVNSKLVPSLNGGTSSITSSNIEFLPLYAAGGAGSGPYQVKTQTTPTAGDKIKGNFSSGGGATSSEYTNRAGSGGSGNGVSGNGGDSWGTGGGAAPPPEGNGGTHREGSPAGAGVTSSISGTSISYGGGGGNVISNGRDGGGNGSRFGNASDGAPNRGGGGGGGRDGAIGGKGGSGIVIIRFNSIIQPVNCIGNWSDWSSCNAICNGRTTSINGIKTRTYNITTAATGSGICPSIETLECIKTDCSVNCVGNYSDWTDTSNNPVCPSSTNYFIPDNSFNIIKNRTRRFNILYDALNGGSCHQQNITNVTGIYNFSCPRDCSGNYSDWTDTSNNPVCPSSTNYFISDNSFNIIKNRTRRFDILYDALNGGTCYQADISNTSGTYNFNCPRDCSGNYSDWTDTSNNPVCPSSTNYFISDNSFNIIKNRTRRFNILYDALNGGSCHQQNITNVTGIYNFSCPRDCSGNYSDWTDTSNNPVCPSSTNYFISDNSFNIIKNRTRRFDILYDALNGGSCFQQNIINTNGTYNFDCPRDCSGNYSNWTDTSNNPVCPSSTNYFISDNSFNIIKNRTRKFNILYDALNGGSCFQQNIINTNGTYNFDCPRDCSGNYSNWTDTSNNPVCPSSTNYFISDNSFNIIKNRTRKFNILYDALNGGSCSQQNIINTSGIYNFDCPRDCSGNWSIWNDCSTNTDTRTRTYKIIYQAKNNGLACPSELLESKKCESKNIFSIIFNIIKLFLLYIFNLMRV
jgi:hypothetical protein